MNSLPGADFEADAEPLGCDFAMHDAGGRHAVCAQMQYIAGKVILWWLLWDDDGYRELRIAPGCRRSVVAESCLLIWDHPGECNQDCGLTREDLREALDSARRKPKELADLGFLSAPEWRDPLPLGRSSRSQRRICQGSPMATVDRPHRLGFAGIPALGAGILAVIACAATGVEATPWAPLAAAAGGVWGYWYSGRWSTSVTR
ncbi:hypothetical protein [Streptomyces sp. NBC_00425]|uniref:hypothetical protein n=1 Tax=Streptomyces sp. NBC_00425 TaxID=2975740 RepID=UPI002E208B26